MRPRRFRRGVLRAGTGLPAIDEQGYRRKQANTFFTFPEWYIVYSFEDFGRFLDSSSESQFGYLSHILGFWRSFCTINRAVPESGESRFDVKTMIYVIGVSYSVEYAIKGFYENTIGRITEWIRGSARTPQDDYARKVVQDYAAFLYTIPWYKFPFGEKLDGLMAISAPTPSSIRSWERDFALGAEYFVKIGYAWLIQKALDASSDERAARHHAGGGDAAAGRAGEGAAHQADPRSSRRNGSWCRRRATRISPRSSRACWIKAFRLPRSPAITKSSSP